MNIKPFYKFSIPSLIGILLFVTPIIHHDEITIPIAILSKKLVSFSSSFSSIIIVSIIIFTACATFLSKIYKPHFILRDPYLKSVFHPNTIWTIIRIIGLLLIICIHFKIGPSFIWSENTGGLVLHSLLPILLVVFFLAGLLLPLLLNFGLLEFIGTILTKVMRPIFKLPGRASIDCVASWLGDGTIGVLLTSKQFEQRFYTEKEAAIIGTTFSAVSITFSLVVVETVGLGNLFIPFYLTVTFAGFIAAIIMPRIPPLSRKKNTYFQNEKGENQELIPLGYSPIKWGIELAKKRAVQNFHVKSILKEGVQNVIDMWIGVLPIVLTVGTTALVLAENTPIFKWIGLPFIPLLELLQIPEAHAASQTMVVGFADMFIPSVMAAGMIESPLTKFVIAALSVTQLIYMAEVGGLLLGSKIPINFKDLVLVFLLRTIITLPIISLSAHIIF